MTPAAWIALASAMFTVSVFLGGIIFHMGKMTQRIIALENGELSNKTVGERLIRQEERMSNVQEDISSMKRTLQEMQRSLSNIATKKFEFSAE